MAQAKRDFGSFHASNVEDLISLPEDVYEPPSFPFKLPKFYELLLSPLKCGETARKEFFQLDDSCIFLNHGAFGACLTKVLDCVQLWQRYIEKQPLRFFDRELLPHMVYVTRQMATFLKCDATNLILIPNVTTGVNAIMRSLPLKHGDIVYHLSLEYGAVKKILSVVCEEKGASVQEQSIPLPLESEEQLLSLVRDSLPAAGCRLAVFDHIPSNTPFILPIKQLAALCHDRGIQVLIDGAHAVGQIVLDIPSLAVDFYLSNCHKWFCGPKGTAVMYISPEHQKSIHPLVISHGYQAGFHSQFIWTGLQDYSPYLALHTALSFWQNADTKEVTTRNKLLADEAAQLLVTRWESHLLAPPSMTGSLLCVALPKDLYSSLETLSYSHAEAVQNELYNKHHIEVPIKCVANGLYVRLSVHVYNTIEEYEQLGNSVLQLNKDTLFQQH